VALHVFQHLQRRHMGPERAGTRFHDAFNGLLWISAQRLGIQPAKHYTRVVDDDARVLARSGQLRADFADASDEATSRRQSGEIPDALSRRFPFNRQTIGHPVELAGDVIGNIPETKAFEPRRGPRAQVSLIVEAVDNYRAVSLEKLHRPFSIQLSQRNVDRAREVLFLVLSVTQHFNELTSLLEQTLDLFSIHRSRHDITFLAPASLSDD